MLTDESTASSSINLCHNVHHRPLEQNLLLAHGAIIDLPVVEVERTRDEGGLGVSME